MSTRTQQRSWTASPQGAAPSAGGGAYRRASTLVAGSIGLPGRDPLWNPPTSTQPRHLPGGPRAVPAATAPSGSRLAALPREVLLAPIPALLLAVALSLWLALNTADPVADRSEQARLLASQTAPLVAEPLGRGDVGAIARMLRSLNRQPEAVHLRVLDADGRVAAEDGRLTSRKRPLGERRQVSVDKPIFDEQHGGRTMGSVQVAMSLPEGPSPLRRGLLALALLSSALVALSVLIGYWLARKRSAPIRDLAGAVQRLSQGELNVEIPVSESGDFGKLQQGVNATAAALRSGLGQLDLQIRRATTLLARKNAELEAASAEKTRFLAAASHDLRQPLHALNMFTANLRDGEHDTARLQRIGQVQECVESLDRLFTGLLDVSRLDAGTETPVETRFSLDALFVEVSQNFRALAEARGLRLIVRQTPLWVRCDRGMLARVLNNLVCNAIRYTPTGGVLLGARLRNNQVRIDVWDTGVGIAPEHQPLIFDEFVRFADAAGDRGLGLGLATVRRLCKLMQAPLEFRSIPGSGTAFNLLLPRAAAGRVQLRNVAAGAAPGDLRGLRVLVIDDEAAILDGMQPLLQSWGCEALVAESLDDARRRMAVSGFVPQLIISDLRLRKGQNGIDAIRAIREAVRGPVPAAMLITGETCPVRIREAAQLKLPLLCKPVASAALHKAIAATVAAHIGTAA